MNRLRKVLAAPSLIVAAMVISMSGSGGTSAYAANSVVVESKTVAPGAVGVPIHIRLTNDVALSAAVVPLEIREIEPGAFITALSISYGDRLVPGVLDDLVNVRNQYNGSTVGTCKNGQPGGLGGPPTFNDGALHPVSGPNEGVMFARASNANSLPVGFDASGSMILTLNIGVTAGRFTIDTTCVNPANHLLFNDINIVSYVPSFTAGTITISTTMIVTSLADAGPGTLREKINYSFVTPGPDTITFAVAGVIALTSNLQPLGAAGGVYIRGLSAPGATPQTPTVILDGGGFVGQGLVVTASNCFVEALEIRKFAGYGLDVCCILSQRNTIRYCRVHSNGSPGIDLNSDGVTPNDPGDADSGPNTLLNYPVIDTVLLAGSDSVYYVAGTSAKKSIVDLYLAQRYLGADTVQHSSGHGDAWQYLGSTTADNATGHFAFPQVYSRKWSYVTATATDTLGNTSEFSLNRSLVQDSLVITAYSPVDIMVKSPNGLDSIGQGFNTLATGAGYDSTHDYGVGPNGILGELDDRVTIKDMEPGVYHVVIIPNPGVIGGNYFLGIRVDGTNEVYARAASSTDTTLDPSNVPYPNPVPAAGQPDRIGVNPVPQRRGDMNNDGRYDVLDVVGIINVTFRAGAFPSQDLIADVNCDGLASDVRDVVRMVDVVFRAGPEPCL